MDMRKYKNLRHKTLREQTTWHTGED